MVKKIGGLRRKTRHKLKKNIREKGKISIRNFFQDFKRGDQVRLSAESAIQRGLYPLRFYGKHGIIQEKRGSCYKVLIKDQDKKKVLIVHPVHLIGVKNVRTTKSK